MTRQASPSPSVGQRAEPGRIDLWSSALPARSSGLRPSQVLGTANLARLRSFGRRHKAADLLAVFLGGSAGGALRYVVVSAWPAPVLALPWSTWAVNVVGSFVVALVVVASESITSGPFLRMALATGLCGALTTFASIVIVADQLAAHGRTDAAIGYVAATIVGGLAAGSLGLVTGRAIRANRVRTKR